MKQNLSIRHSSFFFGCAFFLSFCTSGYSAWAAPDERTGDGILETRINLKCTSCSLKEVFHQLTKNTGTKFIFSYNDINGIAFDNLGYVDQPLGEVLNSILAPHKLTYKVMNERIIIKREQPLPSGTIRGKVYDVENPANLLIGATVRVDGTTIGAVTDVNGIFEISRVPEGVQTLTVSYVGYKIRKIAEVKVIAGSVAMVDVAMSPDTEELSGVVVEGDIAVQYAPIVNSTEVTMVQSIRQTPGIATGISNMQISQSLDRDAGDVVKRVPGVSVVDNFVLVRGMNPRYNITMLNGMLLPSSDRDTRAFNFSLLPSGLIDQIMVYKTASPDLPGNFGGGVLKVTTKNTSVARRIQVSLSGQYRPGSSFKDHIGYKGSSKDWYGGGVDDRQLPAILLDPDYDLPAYADYPAEVAQMARQLPSVRIPKAEYHNVDKRARINYYDSWRLGSDARLSNLTSVGYTNQRQFIQRYLAYDYGKLIYSPETDEYIPAPQYGGQQSDDSLYTQGIRISAMENLTLKVNDNHSLSFNSFFNRSTNDHLLIRMREGENQELLRTYSFKYTRRDMYQLQFSGEHKFMPLHKIDWSIGRNKIVEDVPDLQRFNYLYFEDDLWAYTPGGLENARMTLKTEEEANIYQFNYTHTRPQGIKLKMGVYRMDGHRLFNSGRYQIGGRGEHVEHPEPWNGYIDSLLSQHFKDDGTGELYLEKDPAAGRYEIDDRLWAGYLMAGIPFFNGKLQVNAGIRYEWNERYLYDENGQVVDSIKIDAYTYQKTPNKIQDYLLPSINMSYSYSDKSLVRLAYGKTLDRPQFREQANFDYFDFENGWYTKGSPLLRNAQIHNFDLRWEHYPGASEFIAVGLFYKRLNDAIELRDATGPGFRYPLYNPINTKRADIYGIEVEVRKNLAFITPYLSDFSVILNGSLLESQIDAEKRISGNEEAFKDRPMQGASPYLVNLGLYYDHEQSGTKASVMYNLMGPRLRAVLDEDAIHGGLFEMERHLLDITVTQKVGKHLSIKAGVQNLLNTSIRYFRDENHNRKYNDPDENPVVETGNQYRNDYIETRYKEGAYYSMGLTFSF